MIDGAFDRAPVSSKAATKQGFTNASELTKTSIKWEDANITGTDAARMHFK
jgi:hypothetical protein